jgi:hypothetical protein
MQLDQDKRECQIIQILSIRIELCNMFVHVV